MALVCLRQKLASVLGPWALLQGSWNPNRSRAVCAPIVIFDYRNNHLLFRKSTATYINDVNTTIRQDNVCELAESIPASASIIWPWPARITRNARWPISAIENGRHGWTVLDWTYDDLPPLFWFIDTRTSKWRQKFRYYWWCYIRQSRQLTTITF